MNPCAERLVAAVAKRPDATGLERRILAQAGRELLLAQSSDWAFILRAGTAVGYAEARVREHVAMVHALLDGLEAGRIDVRELEAREARVNLFPWLQPEAWTAAGAPFARAPVPAG